MTYTLRMHCTKVIPRMLGGGDQAIVEIDKVFEDGTTERIFEMGFGQGDTFNLKIDDAVSP